MIRRKLSLALILPTVLLAALPPAAPGQIQPPLPLDPQPNAVRPWEVNGFTGSPPQGPGSVISMPPDSIAPPPVIFPSGSAWPSGGPFEPPPQDPGGPIVIPPDVVTPPAAPAQPLIEVAGGLASSLGAGSDRSPLRYRFTWHPDETVRGQPTEMGRWQHNLNAMVPLWIGETDLFALSGTLRADQFDTAAVLPDSGRPFPEELWNVRLAANYMHRFDNGWIGGGNVNVGSSSDEPFAELRDVKVGMMGFLRIPVAERDAWQFSLMYSPLSELPFPLPGIAYQWQPSEDFRMNIGLPFYVWYRPSEDWTLEFSYMVLRTVHAQATYRLHEAWRVYAAFDWANQSWFLHDRSDDKERLFSYDKRLAVGLQATVAEHLTLDVSAGFAFDRFYFTGRDFSDNHHDRIDIDSGLFLSAQLGLKW